ncbi:zinc ribbon domain-containing protein [Okeania hirsuta]|uniref:zinc ribbon domain-containing protein n=1 Tax=Okeania hirsuta TaxID=1458930 RepID=UPI0040554A3B
MRPREYASSLAERAPRDHKLARAISDSNWGELLRQLEYKAKWYGRELIKIDRYFPSSRALL